MPHKIGGRFSAVILDLWQVDVGTADDTIISNQCVNMFDTCFD